MFRCEKLISYFDKDSKRHNVDMVSVSKFYIQVSGQNVFLQTNVYITGLPLIFVQILWFLKGK